MANQFVGHSPVDAGEDEVPDAMFEDGAMPDFEDVLQVRFIAARPWFRKAHVADTTSHFAQFFTSDLTIRRPGRDVVIGQKAIQFCRRDRLPANKVNGGIAQDANRISTQETPYIKVPQRPDTMSGQAETRNENDCDSVNRRKTGV